MPGEEARISFFSFETQETEALEHPRHDSERDGGRRSDPAPDLASPLVSR